MKESIKSSQNHHRKKIQKSMKETQKSKRINGLCKTDDEHKDRNDKKIREGK